MSPSSSSARIAPTLVAQDEVGVEEVRAQLERVRPGLVDLDEDAPTDDRCILETLVQRRRVDRGITVRDRAFERLAGAQDRWLAAGALR